MAGRESRQARWRALWRTRWAELRTAATGVDPGLVRLRLAAGALLSIAVAVGLAAVLQHVSGEPATVVIMSAVLAMVSNIAVNETPDRQAAGHHGAADPARRRRGLAGHGARGEPGGRRHRVRRDHDGRGLDPPLRSARVLHRHGRGDGLLLLPVPGHAGLGPAVADRRGGHRRRLGAARARLPARREAAERPGPPGPRVPRAGPRPRLRRGRADRRRRGRPRARPARRRPQPRTAQRVGAAHRRPDGAPGRARRARGLRAGRRTGRGTARRHRAPPRHLGRAARRRPAPPPVGRAALARRGHRHRHHAVPGHGPPGRRPAGGRAAGDQGRRAG